jgi:dienelactone hydrolase
MIWVCAANTGNKRHPVHRMGLALDAAHNVRSRYEVDPGRVYIAGYSGGAGCAADLVRAYPDVFSGAFCIDGGSFYMAGGGGDDEEPQPTMVWIGTDLPIEQARSVMRLVLLRGERDAYSKTQKTDYASFKLDGFEHVSYFEIPGVGHAFPREGTWLSKGLAALDASRPKTHVPLTITPRERSTKMTFASMLRPLPARDPGAQAARVLATARLWAGNGMPEGAVIGAERVLKEYPATPAAAGAKVLLAQLEHVKPFAVPYGGELDAPAPRALFSARAAVFGHRHDAARLYLERVVTLAPDSPEAVEAKAWLEWMNEHPETARPKPVPPAMLATIVLQSGLAYDRAKLPEAARAAYQRVVRDFPATPAAAAARKRMAQSPQKAK